MDNNNHPSPSPIRPARHRRRLAALGTATAIAVIAPSAFTAEASGPNQAAVRGAAAEATADDLDQPQAFWAVAYGVHVAGKATMYAAAAAAAGEASRGINIWVAGSEPRGAVDGLGTASPEQIFDR